MGTIEAVGKLCRGCGQAFCVTKKEIQCVIRSRKREPQLCEKCRRGRGHGRSKVDKNCN